VSEVDSKSYRPRARFASTTLEQQFTPEEPYYTSNSIHRELLPSSLAQFHKAEQAPQIVNRPECSEREA
jgi:hypothetical protein